MGILSKVAVGSLAVGLVALSRDKKKMALLKRKGKALLKKARAAQARYRAKAKTASRPRRRTA